MDDKLRIVCATREPQERFFSATALGRSLAAYGFPRSEIRLHAANSRGLPSVYNEAIAEAAADPAVLVFIHDDVHLCDFYWSGNILNALRKFDVVGLAGNRRRVARQPVWAFIDENFTWDTGNLSGVVGHGNGFPPERLSVFGQPGQEVKLLDGLMLAARSQILLSHDIRFDERFEFHFYDLDFCRQCELHNLRMGTWSISVIHERVAAILPLRPGKRATNDIWPSGVHDPSRLRWPARIGKAWNRHSLMRGTIPIC